MSKVNVIIIAIGLSLSACGKRIYHIVHDMKDAQAHIVLDDSYRRFVRYVYKGADVQGQTTIKSERDHDIKKELIEVEYLLVSDRYDNVIYITTIPDKYQNRYSSTSPVLTKPDWINAYDFNTFHMGKIVNGDFVFDEFRSGRSVHWVIEENGPRIALTRIDTWLNARRQEAQFVTDALSSPIEFEEMPNKRIVLSTYDTDTFCELAEPRLYLASSHKKYKVYFKFTCPPAAGHTKRVDNNGLEIIYFDHKRIRYSPAKLLVAP
jgi:hypothetical protein